MKVKCSGLFLMLSLTVMTAAGQHHGDGQQPSRHSEVTAGEQSVEVRTDGEAMNQDIMERYVIEHSELVQHEPGYVLFVYNSVQMALVSDVKHDRMRIIAPVSRYEEVDAEHRDAVMEANFHSALDARYALSNGVLYSAYIHPLTPLTEGQLQSAMDQVSNLALSYGEQYSSGELVYAGVAGENDGEARQ